MASQGIGAIPYDLGSHLPQAQLLDRAFLHIQQASELKSSGFPSCPHSADEQAYVTAIFQIHQTRGDMTRWCY